MCGLKYVCPALETVLMNCYQSLIRLAVSDELELLLKEGTTQGDLLGMAMFALAIVPLILKLMQCCQTVYQVCFADDANVAVFCNALSTFGSLFGYNPNASKTCLVVKEKMKRQPNLSLLRPAFRLSHTARDTLVPP